MVYSSIIWVRGATVYLQTVSQGCVRLGSIPGASHGHSQGCMLCIQSPAVQQITLLTAGWRTYTVMIKETIILVYVIFNTCFAFMIMFTCSFSFTTQAPLVMLGDWSGPLHVDCWDHGCGGGGHHGDPLGTHILTGHWTGCGGRSTVYIASVQYTIGCLVFIGEGMALSSSI